MRTRRSRKSFEVLSPKKRRRSTKKKGKKPLLAVNETIVLSDSETEDVKPNHNCDDDDIQVIDVADATGEIEKSDLNDTIVINPVAVACEQSRTSEKVSNKPRCSAASLKPPVVSIDEDSSSALNEDNDGISASEALDGIEFLGYIVSSKGKTPQRKRSSIASVNARKSNGNLQVMQGSIKKAMERVRRSSLNNSLKNLGSALNPPVYRATLNSVAPNSKLIRRDRKGKSRFLNNFNDIRRPRNWNAFNRNRDRENNRRVIFRPENEYPAKSANQRSQNVSNPFFIPGCSRSVRQDEQTPWMPIRRHRDRRVRGPAAIPVGSNILIANSNGSASNRPKGSLRPIVIDGSNLAFGHGEVLPAGGQKFSPRGIQICVEYFRKRGHTEVIAFVPRYRQKHSECRDPTLLDALERDGCVRYTPSREAGPHRITSYDDLFVIQYAHETGGIIISNDNFRDIYRTNPQLQETITLRQMMFTWVTPDVIMFPQDPLGPDGPTIDEFLKF